MMFQVLVRAFGLAALGWCAVGVAAAHDVLPLGDGLISKEARKGYIFFCPTDLKVPDDTTVGPWINGHTWNQAAKVVVAGNVAWANHAFEIKIDGGARVLTGNNIPSHTTGVFPIDPADPAYKYDKNPYRIAVQTIDVRVPARPRLAAKASCVPMGPVGYAVTGVPIYNPTDVFYRDGPAHELQDRCNGHPDPILRYHYHSWSPCIPDASGKAGRHSDLAGYILDGFGIYGPVGENGKALLTRDLDACHGHTHEVMWDGKKVRMFHYHFTADFPYTLNCYRGTPVKVLNGG